MYSNSLRDDISVCSARSSRSARSVRSFGVQRKNSKHSIYADDLLSEYSNPLNWGDRPGPFSLCDYRITIAGLQARRTAGEAILCAQWEQQREADAETCTKSCQCFGPRLARWFVQTVRPTPSRPPPIFYWVDVQSFVLVPHEDKGPYLIAVAILPRLQGGNGLRPRELVLQAGSPRLRARWGIEMSAAILAAAEPKGGGGSVGGGLCRCCGPDCGRMSLALFMDMVRVACEVARLQPSEEGMERLIEVLAKLGEDSRPGNRGGGVDVAIPPVPQFPLAALRRFCEATKRAHEDFREYCHWQMLLRLVPPSNGLDTAIWRGRVLPFLAPSDTSLRDAAAGVYPAAVDSQLTNAAERCRRTFSS